MRQVPFETAPGHDETSVTSELRPEAIKSIASIYELIKRGGGGSAYDYTGEHVDEGINGKIVADIDVGKVANTVVGIRAHYLVSVEYNQSMENPHQHSYSLRVGWYDTADSTEPLYVVQYDFMKTKDEIRATIVEPDLRTEQLKSGWSEPQGEARRPMTEYDYKDLDQLVKYLLKKPPAEEAK